MVERRHLLRLCGFAGVGALAGCAGNFGDESDQTPTNTTSTRTSWDWTRQAKFTAEDAYFGDRFGFSVALSGVGTTALVAAVGEMDSDRRSTETTEDSNTGNASTTETPDSGGAGTAENPDGRKEGAAYVFDASGGSWTQQAKLTVDGGDSTDTFGWSVALSNDGTIAVVGSHHEANPDPKAGSAYVFDASGGSWTQQAKLVTDNGNSGNEFGNSVAVSGDGTTALVAAVGDENPNDEDAGSAYVFDVSAGSWSQQAKLVAADGDSEDGFGNSVALSEDGSTAVVGARRDEDPNGDRAGSAYVFDTAGESWSQQAKLTADDGDSGDGFGFSVAVSDDGTTALISAIWDEDPNGDEAGSAYVFDSSGESWSQQAKLVADDGGLKDRFGVSMALSGDGNIALVSTPETYRMDSGGQGAAYVFGASGGSWNQQAKLPLDDGEGDRFGRSVALSGDGTTSLIGDPRNGMSGGRPVGGAYVFTL
jgi:hypothetical protein